jgi:hypothetical protein
MDWSKDLNEAQQYEKAATGMRMNKKVDNETLYHIICLSVEKYTSTLADMVNYIPMHSSLTFIVRELEKKMDIPSGFLNETKFLNSFMTYCSLEVEEAKPISEEDITRMFSFLYDLSAYTQKRNAIK